VNGPRRFEIILPAELRGRSLLWPMRLAQAQADLARLAILNLVTLHAPSGI